MNRAYNRDEEEVTLQRINMQWSWRKRGHIGVIVLIVVLLFPCVRNVNHTKGGFAHNLQIQIAETAAVANVNHSQ